MGENRNFFVNYITGHFRKNKIRSTFKSAVICTAEKPTTLLMSKKILFSLIKGHFGQILYFENSSKKGTQNKCCWWWILWSRRVRRFRTETYSSLPFNWRLYRILLPIPTKYNPFDKNGPDLAWVGGFLCGNYLLSPFGRATLQKLSLLYWRWRWIFGGIKNQTSLDNSYFYGRNCTSKFWIVEGYLPEPRSPMIWFAEKYVRTKHFFAFAYEG